MTATKQEVATGKWSGFKYKPVSGLANRILSRWLRSQRKNMTRFFDDRGLFTLAERCRQIRCSRQNMLAKNRMFQKVLDDYAKLVSPPGTATESTTETSHIVEEGVVGVPSEGSSYTGKTGGV